MSFLTGYKTYICAFLLAGVALMEGVMHIDVPGVDLAGNWFEVLLGSLGLGALRNAIANS